MVKKDMSKIDAFYNTNSCLRMICNMYWPDKISNESLYRKTGISLVIKMRKLRWLGHVLRMSPNRIPKVALRWTPSGKRKRGWPKTTWRRTVITELEEMGLTLGEAQAKAQDRTQWRQLIAALCPTGDEDD